MATSTFDRPLILSEEGAEKLFALMEQWEKDPPKLPPIKPSSIASREEVDEMLKIIFRPGDSAPKE